MKKFFVLASCAVASAANANMILNGSFEFNSAAINEYNMSNATFAGLVSAVTGFGQAEEIDLMTTAEYGPLPSDGNWKLGIHAQADNQFTDAFSFDLNSVITAGTEYNISFDLIHVTDFDPGLGAVQVGVSNDASNFGSMVFSATGNTSAWSSVSGSFTANSNFSYLTVRNDPSVASSWVHIDNFRLEAVPEPSALAAFGILGVGLFLRRKKIV